MVDLIEFKELWVDDSEYNGQISCTLSLEEENQLRSADWLDHTPGPGIVREDLPREVVYSRAWYRFMHATSVPNLHLWRITLPYYQVPDQQCATLFAAIFTWLGTGNGHCMVTEAENLNKSGISSMTMLWAKKNLRLSYLNHGLSTLDQLFEILGWKRGDISADIVQVTYQLMYFLDGHIGRKLIEYAEHEYKRLRENDQGDR